MLDKDQKPIWITQNSELSQYCEQWLSLSAVALDTEFIRTDTFYPKPGLIQVGTGHNIYLIDPLRISEWQPLANLFSNPQVTKVLHACSEDLEVFKRLTDTPPQALFDTQIGAAYANMGYSLGYQALLRQLLQVNLPKDETRSDWLQRPLTESQVRYASLDVVHLLEAYEALKDQLAGHPHWLWAKEDSQRMTEDVTHNTGFGAAWKEVKKAWQLRPQQLAVLRDLCEFREHTARAMDVPRNRVIPKGSLWFLARYQPKDMRSLSGIQEMRSSVIKKHGEQILALVRQAAQSDSDTWPASLPKPLSKEAKGDGKRIKELLAEWADHFQLPVELVQPNKMVSPILRARKKNGRFSVPESVTGWRRDAIITPLIEQLNDE